MRTSKRNNILMLLGSTLLAAAGQFLFKVSVMGAGVQYVVLSVGVLSYIVSTLIYFYVLSRANLSWTYGIGGLSYIFAVVLANLIEAVPFARWIGVLVITVGVFLIGSS